MRLAKTQAGGKAHETAELVVVCSSVGGFTTPYGRGRPSDEGGATVEDLRTACSSSHEPCPRKQGRRNMRVLTVVTAFPFLGRVCVCV